MYTAVASIATQPPTEFPESGLRLSSWTPMTSFIPRQFSSHRQEALCIKLAVMASALSSTDGQEARHSISIAAAEAETLDEMLEKILAHANTDM